MRKKKRSFVLFILRGLAPTHAQTVEMFIKKQTNRQRNGIFLVTLQPHSTVTLIREKHEAGDSQQHNPHHHGQ
ncbi:MAG: hypothetical protein SPL67_02435 [Prevotella sp.]|nr:hypothetical protein [Prevotella sp.]